LKQKSHIPWEIWIKCYRSSKT